MTSADCIVVLGCSLHDAETRGNAVRRAERAAALWHQGRAPLIICCGGSTHNIPQTEAAFLAEQLIRLGVPATSILREERSTTTVGNAAYLADMLYPRQVDSIMVVTSEYHVRRAKFIFRQTFPDLTISFKPCRSHFSFWRWLGFTTVNWWHEGTLRLFGLHGQRR